MIDLKKGSFVFRKHELSEIRDDITTVLPQDARVEVKDGRAPQITIREGMWRGVSLTIAKEAEQAKLTGMFYRIPSFAAKIIVFIVSVAVFSTIVMIAISAVVGEFVPAVLGVGGVAGFAMYSLMEKVFLANIKSSWIPELHQSLEKLKA